MTRVVIEPPGAGKCPICACCHPENAPHNRESLYYQMRFRQEHGRFPTWKDAAAHCTDEMRAVFKEQMRQSGVDISYD